ncbi:MAG: hypothetical protein P8Y46_06025 [Sulfurovaceae bacterium]
MLTALRRLTPAFIFRKIRFFFFGTTIRNIFTAFFMLLALYLAYNIKTIPNYATKRGYEIVWRDDYEKYNQGYCLVEDRILDEEEIYTRGLRQYLDKNKIAIEKSLDGVCGLFDSIAHCDYEDQAISVDYYALDKITSLNWYELIHSRPGAENEEKGHREFFFDELNATQVDPKKYLTVDMRSMIAGFSRPIIMYTGGRRYRLMPDKAFILNRDQGYIFSIIYIFISETSKFDNYDKESYYYSLQEKIGNGSFRIDNCGNVGLSIEKSVESSVDFTRNGG